MQTRAAPQRGRNSVRVRVIDASDAVQRAGSPAGVSPEHVGVGGGARRASLQPFKVATLVRGRKGW